MHVKTIVPFFKITVVWGEINVTKKDFDNQICIEFL